MNQATYFETRSFSPTSLTLIVVLHAVAVTAALTWTTVFIVPDRKPIVVTTIPLKKDPAPTPDTPKHHIQRIKQTIFVPQHNQPASSTNQDLIETTIGPTDPTFDNRLPPLPPDPPRPPRILESARARGDVRTLITSDDYPESARRSEQAGTVQARLDIGTDGKVTGCTILNSSGSAALDAVTCRVLRARARFTPARNGDGQAVSDSYVTPRIVWKIEGRG